MLDQFFDSLSSGGHAYVIGDSETPNRNWHIYYATEEPELPMVTLEMCMTGLNKDRASIFFNNSLDGVSSSGKEMTRLSGICDIIPEMDICDFEFKPCGYSMNGIHGPAVSTIHVAPEEGFSYASYEAMGFDPSMLYGELIERVLRCFDPSDFSVAVTIFGGRGQAGSWGNRVDVDGYACEDLVEQELPGGGLLMYQSFSAATTVGSPRSILHCWDNEDAAEEIK